MIRSEKIKTKLMNKKYKVNKQTNFEKEEEDGDL